MMHMTSEINFYLEIVTSQSRVTNIANNILHANLSWSICNNFDAIHCKICVAAQNRKKSLKIRLLDFKVVQGHRC